MNDARIIRKFLQPAMGRMIGSIVAIVFCALFLIVALIVVPVEEYSIKYCFALLIIAGLVIKEGKRVIGNIKITKALNAQIEELNKNGYLPIAMEEFKNADPLCKGTLRLGDHFVFGKHSGILLEYKDITRVFQYVHNNKQRELHVITTTGETLILDKLKIRDGNEAQEIMERMHMINSQIQITFDE